MSFIAEFGIETPVLRATSTGLPDAEFVMEDLVLGSGGEQKFLFRATHVETDALEAALASDETIADFAQIEAFDGASIYRVTFAETVSDLVTYHIAAAEDSFFLDMRLQDGVGQVKARMRDRAALESYRDFCQANDIAFTLDRIYTEQGADGAEFDLSAAQHEAIVSAFELGYYDSPRTATLEDVAAELGISPQAVSDRLQRGHRHLVAATVAP